MSAATAPQRWLFGPVTDLTLGCGLGYMVLFVFVVFAGPQTQSVLHLGWIPIISILTGTPHYGATLLRVYEQRSERKAYALFAIYVTAAVWALFYVGLYEVAVGSLLLTVYLTWSPWHYTGQNYGIGLMFLHRRGVRVTPRSKRLIYLSFLLSYLLTVLAIHGANADAEYAPVQPYQGGVFHMLRLGIPSPLWEALFLGLGVIYLGITLAAGALLLRGGARPRDLGPTAMLALTQLLWFSLPPLARHLGWFGPDAPFARTSTTYAFFWVATGHTVQYMWITTYYAARSQGYGARVRFFGKALAAGSFIWSVPALLYTLSLEGGRFSGAAMGGDVGVLLGATVNLHHFILDGVIWKLRDGRVARILIRREAEPEPGELPEPIGPRRRWLAPAVYALGAFFTITVIGSWWQREFGLKPALARGDLRGAHTALERLDWLGHDSADDYRRAGKTAQRLRSYGEASAYYRRSLAKHPSAATFVALGQLAHAGGELEEAQESFEKALELNPNHLNALYLLGSAWLQRGETERALELLEHAARVAPYDPTVAASVKRARQRLADGGSAPGADELQLVEIPEEEPEAY